MIDPTREPKPEPTHAQRMQYAIEEAARQADNYQNLLAAAWQAGDKEEIKRRARDVVESSQHLSNLRELA